MIADKHVPNWQLVYECVKSQGGRATIREIATYLRVRGRVTSNARPDATLLSVNEGSRVHYIGKRDLRRTDSKHRHDLLFREADGSYVLYDPMRHGVWEIYKKDDGTRAVRLVEEPNGSGDALTRESASIASSEETRQSLISKYRTAIEAPEVRSAFDLLVSHAQRLSDFRCEPHLKGPIKSFRYHDSSTSETPFSFIVNKHSLLFYVRKSGLRRVGSLSQLGKRFRNVSENAGGEITIRISSAQDAAQIVDVLFRSTTSIIPIHKSSSPGVTVMAKLSVPAARVQQGDLTLFATSISVGDLLARGFYSVETLDPENANDSGYQRLLNTARARKLADYVLKGQDSNDAFLPTSIFLATDKLLPFDEATNTLTIDTQAVGAFSVVDGQHRLEGLRIAAEKDERVTKFQLPVNIAVGLPKIAQMCHFLIVNTTQKSVDKSVEQRLIGRLTAAIDIEDVPTLPKWILRAVERGEVDKAVRYADFLNETEDSPWHGKIRMANTDSDEGTINQKSFVKSLVKYVLTANNPLTALRDFDKEKRVFLNYWKAIKELLDDGDAAVLYKYNGVELFCKFSIPFFMKLQDKGSFTVQTMTELLRACFENVEGEYAGVGHPEWWHSGSTASFLNAGAINQVAQELSRALHKSSMRTQIEL